MKDTDNIFRVTEELESKSPAPKPVRFRRPVNSVVTPKLDHEGKAQAPNSGQWNMVGRDPSRAGQKGGRVSSKAPKIPTGNLQELISNHEQVLLVGSRRLVRNVNVMPMKQLIVMLPRVAEMLSLAKGENKQPDLHVTLHFDRPSIHARLSPYIQDIAGQVLENVKVATSQPVLPEPTEKSVDILKVNQ